MLTRLKVYRADANTFIEIYGKLKASDTQENANFIIKPKKTLLGRCCLFYLLDNYNLVALKVDSELKLG